MSRQEPQSGGSRTFRCIREHLRRFSQPYTVLAIALTATALVFGWARATMLREQQDRFNQVASTFRHTLEIYFSAYINILNSLSGLIGHEGGMPTPQGFRTFLDAQGLRESHAGIFDMGYVARVRPQDRAGIVELARHREVRVENLPRFNDGAQDDFILLHWYDFKTVEPALFAFHVFHEPDRLPAMEKARDSGAIACSAKVNVFIGAGQVASNGCILYAPQYATTSVPQTEVERREQLRGFAFMSFFIPELWGSVYRATGEPGLDLEVYDGRNLSRDALWWDSDDTLRGPGAPASVKPPKYVSVQAVAGLGREWTFHLAGLPAFEATLSSRIPWMILVAGLSVTVALFSLSFMQTQSRLRAESLAEEVHGASETMTAEKERLAVTLGSIGDGVIALDAHGAVTLMNRSAEAQTGWSQEAARGLPLRQVLNLQDPQSNQPCVCPVESVLGSGHSWRTERTSLFRGNGTQAPLTVSVQLTPMHDSLNRVFGAVVVLQDVTERERSFQEQLRHSRIESVGLLAGGIAHDFNNILTAIRGNVSLAALDAAQESEQRAILRDAELACVRARDLTQQLLTFAKGGTPIRTSARLDTVISESARFATHGSAARCELHLAEDMWPVQADKGQIAQVIQNIVLNAVEAMPTGGMIQIRASNTTLGEGNSLGLPAGRHVLIAIEDQGGGIPPEHLGRIFDPYFSTKQRGSGFGLATAYSIVKRHEGTITVRSTLGAGSCFEIYLPASPTPEQPLPPVPPTTAHRGGCILVMDDEESLLKVLTHMLRKLGYRVLAASDGAEAVRLHSAALAAGQAISAVLLDLTVPGGMGGEEALRQMRSVDPELKAVASSGYSSSPVMANHRAFGFHAVVPKPYTIEILSTVLAELLAPDPGTGRT